MKMSSVMIPIANYGTFALAEIAYMVLLPLFYASPISIGGLGLSPPIIGAYLATLGVLSGILQVLFAARIIECVGPKRLFRFAVVWFYPLVLIFPIMSAVVMTQGKVGPVTWTLIVIQLIFLVIMELSYSAFDLFLG